MIEEYWSVILIHSGNQGFGAVGSHDSRVLECHDGEKILLLIHGRGYLWVHSKMAVAGDLLLHNQGIYLGSLQDQRIRDVLNHSSFAQKGFEKTQHLNTSAHGGFRNLHKKN